MWDDERYWIPFCPTLMSLALFPWRSSHLSAYRILQTVGAVGVLPRGVPLPWPYSFWPGEHHRAWCPPLRGAARFCVMGLGKTDEDCQVDPVGSSPDRGDPDFLRHQCRALSDGNGSVNQLSHFHLLSSLFISQLQHLSLNCKSCLIFISHHPHRANPTGTNLAHRNGGGQARV